MNAAHKGRPVITRLKVTCVMRLAAIGIAVLEDLTPYITGSKKLRIEERGAKLFAVRVNAFVSLIS